MNTLENEIRAMCHDITSKALTPWCVVDALVEADSWIEADQVMNRVLVVSYPKDWCVNVLIGSDVRELYIDRAAAINDNSDINYITNIHGHPAKIGDMLQRLHDSFGQFQEDGLHNDVVPQLEHDILLNRRPRNLTLAEIINPQPILDIYKSIKDRLKEQDNRKIDKALSV